jgi:Uma2 family endonuclease
VRARGRSTTEYPWLHDDAEEDLVGSDWHQQAIIALYTSLTDLARRNAWPWHVGNQLTLVGWKPDGTIWRPSPDIMIHPGGGTAKRREMIVHEDGAPALIIEVASDSTWAYDVDRDIGKAAGYLHLGVQDYLVFDPTGDLVGKPCRGWQRQDDVVREWELAPDGRYHSTSLDISFSPDGDYLRLFDPAGRPVPYHHEKSQIIADLEAELRRLQDPGPQE